MDLQNSLTEEQIKKFTTEFGLTKEQIIEYSAEFKAYDHDRDGTITAKDLGMVNKAFGGNTTDDVLQEWIKKSDFDGDEKVNFYEFLKFNAMSLKKQKDKQGLFYDEM